VRAATIAALKASSEVTALVGTRVYPRQGLEGGISNQGTPEAFTAEGDLLPSIVVTLETRTAETTRGGAPKRIKAIQVIALWVYQARGYDPLWEVVRRAKRVLHRTGPMEPVTDPVSWLDTDWASDTAELVDQDLGAALIVSRYAALIVDPLGPPA
jgi:hypothetical protein